MTIARNAWIACVTLAAPLALALATPEAAFAQNASSPAEGTPLVQLIESVSKKTGKNFILDPHVEGNAKLIGIDPSKVSYADLLTILQVNGYAAVESAGLVRVVPEATGRTMPSPMLDDHARHPDAEIVTRVIRVKSVPASQLVPIMRSLLPRSAHFAAVPCTNELLIVDTYANVRRIEGIVATMDKGAPLALPECELRSGQPARPLEPPPPSPPAKD